MLKNWCRNEDGRPGRTGTAIDRVEGKRARSSQRRCQCLRIRRRCLCERGVDRATVRQRGNCLDEAGLNPEQLDYVGFYDKPLLKFERLI